MKRFIIKTACWLLFLFLLGYALASVTKYKLYGEYFIRQKVNYYSKQGAGYNALVFGSSRMYRQVNTGLLDSATAHRVKAYNMASGGTFFSESIYEYRHTDIHKNVKYLFFEIQDVQPFDINAYTEKFLYYHDLPTVNFELKYFVHNNDWNSSFLSVSHFFANIFYFKKLGQRDKTVNEFTDYNNGYFPLEKDYKNMVSVRKARSAYLKDTTMIYKNRINAEKSPKKKLNPALISEIRLLAEDCQKKGIRLFLVLPPFCTPTDLSDIKTIPDTKILDFSSRKAFSEFYTNRNAYDNGHLNSHGAVLFTHKLADSLNRIIR
ncbi:hypothetical protein [uncultured Chryseobacterium sp.]|uniref:hypothetical protein n=1 Tax=uncultured Chryseobacterium sp. TaxID=259322 RepID=UPI0025E918E7|nr:hypothetical protein [uncultured Chryseobacterium sp.]